MIHACIPTPGNYSTAYKPTSTTLDDGRDAAKLTVFQLESAYGYAWACSNTSDMARIENEIARR